MKIKTADLTGAQLDWAVGVSQNVEIDGQHRPIWFGSTHSREPYTPSTDWAQGGPVLTEARISRTIDHSGLWIAYIAEGYGDVEDDQKFMQCDRSELVAGLRCRVSSKLGDKVDIPEELKWKI